IEDFQHRPVPLLRHTQLHQHTQPPPCDQHLIAGKRPGRLKPGTSTECRPPTGTTVAHLPEPRPQPVAQEPELRCPASTGIAHAHGTDLATEMAPAVISTKVDMCSDLVGDTGIEPVTSSV